MSRDTTVIRFRQPETIDDPLTEIAREGARRMLAQVLIAEADAFVAHWNDVKLPDGRDRVVRHGHGPQRAIQTGVGAVEVRRAKVRDRGSVGTADKIRFTSAILPKWARRTKSLDACFRSYTCAGFRPGAFMRLSLPSSAKTRTAGDKLGAGLPSASHQLTIVFTRARFDPNQSEPVQARSSQRLSAN